MDINDCKTQKKDTRSSITVKLPAVYADFVVGLLARELDNARREGQEDLTAAIQDILKPFRNAIALEDKQRALRGQQRGGKRDK